MGSTVQNISKGGVNGFNSSIHISKGRGYGFNSSNVSKNRGYGINISGKKLIKSVFKK